MRWGVIDAAQLLSGAVDVCRPMLEKKHNRLESDSGEGITLWGNTEMLLQVLINLTVNANRHTENGVIAYRIADEGERVCLRVSDTGSGHWRPTCCRISLRRAAAAMEAAVSA